MIKKVAVVGSGITGVLAAYYLTKEGYQVTVFDQEPYPAMRTSYANGGQISVSNSEVWTTWSNVQKGLKWIFKKDAPLLIRPRFDLSQWRWIAKFLYHTIKGDYKKNTAETIQLGLESRTLYQQIIKDEGIEFDFSQSGILHFYKEKRYFENAQAAKSLYNENSVEWDIVDQEFVNSRQGLKHIKNVIGGAWTPSDSVGDIHKFCLELHKVLKKNYGVKFIFDKQVYGDFVELLAEEFDIVVISAGVGSAEISKHFKDNLNIYPIKGYSITIHNNDKDNLPKVSLLDDQAKIVTSTLGDRLRVAGTAELAGENYDIRRDRIEPLLNWVKENLPHINTKDYSSWACLRPMTPNMMPIVCRSKRNSKVYYHTGHGHLGWTLSPATAKKLVELIKND